VTAVPATPTATPSRRRSSVWRRFARHRVAIVGLVLLAVLAVCTFGARLVAPYPPNEQDLLLGATPPSSAHLLGTDELGRDYLTELLYAGQISLSIAFAVAFVSTVVGVAVGAIAGYRGGWVDDVFMRVTDLFLVVPGIALLAVALQGLGRSPIVVVFVLAGRGEVLSLREREFIDAARVIGNSGPRVVLKHVLPNLAGVIAVNVALSIAGAIIIESSLSFLGFGVQPPETSWGNMLSQASGLVGTSKVFLLYFPGLFILVTVLAVNFVGDGLRDALDPRSGTGVGGRR
jgi:peptide/nickel transport system permease protein